MKNSILLLGLIAFGFNTILGFLLSGIDQFHLILTDLSIIASIVLMYVNAASNNNDGFKIGLGVVFAISGFIRYILAYLTKSEVEDNPFLILVIIIFFIELASLAMARFLSNRK